MNPRTLSLLCLAGLAPVIDAQATFELESDVELRWEQIINGPLPARDTLRDVATAAGRVYVLQQNAADPNDVALVHAHDAASGALLWTGSYTGFPDANRVEPDLLVAAPDGSRVYAVIEELGFLDPDENSTPRRVVVVALDGTDGETLWTQTVTVYAPLFVLSTSLALSTSGDRLYLGGRIHVIPQFGFVTQSSAYVLTLSTADGSIDWFDGYDGPDGLFDGVESLAVDPLADRLYAAIRVGVDGSESDTLTRAYDGSDGTILWDSFHSGPAEENELPKVVVTDGAAVYVGCDTTSASPLVIYDAVDGSLLGSEGFGGASVDSLALSPLGDSLVAHGLLGALSRVESFALTVGGPDWFREFPLQEFEEDESAGVVITPDGSTVLATTSFRVPEAPPYVAEFRTHALDAGDGSDLWVDVEVIPAQAEIRPAVASPSAPSGLAIFAREQEASDGKRVVVDARGAFDNSLTWSVVEPGPVPNAGEIASYVELSPDGTSAFVVLQEGQLTGPDFQYVDTVRELDLETGETLSLATLDVNWLVFDMTLGPGPGRVSVVSSELGPGWVATSVDTATGATVWTTTWSGIDEDGGLDDPTAVLSAPDGSALFATGEMWTSNVGGVNGNEIGTVAWDGATGDVLWGAGYSETPGFGTTGLELAVSGDSSRLFVSGVTRVGPDENLTVLAYDAVTGAELWARTLPGADDEAGETLLLSPDESQVYVAGTVFSAADGRAVLGAAALDAVTGAVLWIDEAGAAPQLGTGPSVPAGAWLSPDGATLYHAGSGPLLDGKEVVRVAAVDTATGARVWTSIQGATGDLIAEDLSGTPDGRALHVLATSPAQGDGDELLRVLAIDTATGQRLWTADRSQDEHDTGELVSTDDGVVVVASTNADGFFSDALFLRYDPQALQSAPGSVSLVAGGTQSLQVSSPDVPGVAGYWVLGSATGTAPGVLIGGQLLPLVFDAYFAISLVAPNAPPFVNSLGLVDGSGNGSAAIALPAGLDPTLAGATLYHAAFFFGPAFEILATTNATPLLLTP